MNGDILNWLGGLSLLAGGLLATAGWLLFAWHDPEHKRYDARHWLPYNFLIIGGGVFMSLGLPAFYVPQAEATGGLGLLSFIVFYIGLVIPYVAVHAIETASMPDVPPRMMRLVFVGAPALMVGLLLTGITTILAAVYPPWLGTLFIVYAVVSLMLPNLGLPAWLERGVAPALFTLTMSVTGFLVMTL